MVGENCPVRDLREGCHDVIETDLLFTNNCLLATSFPAPRANTVIPRSSKDTQGLSDSQH